MNASILLRVAAVLTLLYALGHLSGYPWTPGESAEAAGVVEAMQRTRFDAMGANRTYWDFYIGFGLIIGLSMIAEAIALWFLAPIAGSDARPIRPIIAVFALAYAGNAYLSWNYFFTIPVVFAVAIVLTLVAAFARARLTTSPA